MKIKHIDIEPHKETPFLDCKLGREKLAGILTDIVKNYQEGFVLAIDGEWGTGKTTFVKMWRQQLQNEGLHTLYFNAWENDFEDNPLVALLAEFKALTGKKDNSKYKSVVEKGAVILKNIAPEIIKSIAQSHVATKAIAAISENVMKGATEILEEDIKEYNKKKEGIKEFKNALEQLVESIEGEKPIVFIIDELDRCRPNYAVSLLEQLKHLFSVNGIVFVLAIDKEQLGHAVRGVYGSDNLNADEYLRRFIDLEYRMPRPDTKTFVTYLYDYFGLNEKLLQEGRHTYREFQDESQALVDMSTILFERAGLTLRQQEKIFAHARIALRSLRYNQHLFPTLFIFLIYLKQHQNKIYIKIQNKDFNTQEVLDSIARVIPSGIEKDNVRYIIHLEALLALLYHNYKYERDWRNNLFTKDKETEQENVNVKSHFDNSEGQHEFVRFIKLFCERDYSTIPIKNVLDKIDLLLPVS